MPVNLERQKTRSREWYRENRERILKQRQEYQRKNRARIKARVRERYHGRYRARKLAKIYGVSVERIHELLAIRSCQICGDGMRLVMDHDHRSGKLRGRLCSRCNTGIGQFLEDPIRLAAAIQYLRMEAGR